MNREDYNNKIISDAVDVLKNGGVIILPTDTVYGLAINSSSDTAIKKIYKIKKRNLEKKLPLVVNSYDMLKSICEIDDDQLKRLHTYYPGKLTLILKKKNSSETVAVRMINNEIINKIIENLNSPLMLTSANISGENISSDILDILELFDGQIDMAVIGSKVSNISSTIVEIRDDQLILVREGAISFKDIENSFYRGK